MSPVSSVDKEDFMDKKPDLVIEVTETVPNICKQLKLFPATFYCVFYPGLYSMLWASRAPLPAGVRAPTWHDGLRIFTSKSRYTWSAHRVPWSSFKEIERRWNKFTPETKAEIEKLDAHFRSVLDHTYATNDRSRLALYVNKSLEFVAYLERFTKDTATQKHSAVLRDIADLYNLKHPYAAFQCVEIPHPLWAKFRKLDLEGGGIYIFFTGTVRTYGSDMKTRIEDIHIHKYTNDTDTQCPKSILDSRWKLFE